MFMVTFMEILPWLVLVVFLLLFYKPIADFIRGVTKANLPGGVSVERDYERAQNAVRYLRESIEDLEKVTSGRFYLNYKRAFVDAEDLVRKYLQQHKNIDDILEIRVLAVGMTYSWKYFIMDIPQLLEENSGCRISLKLLYVDPDLLTNLNLKHREDEKWHEQSQKRKTDIEKFIKDIERFAGRITITAKTYRSLPFWHGVLINGEHLFVGRTDWDLMDVRPLLSVGKNKYRYYLKSHDNDNRVARFEHWHQYFFEFNSDLVASNDRERDGLNQTQAID
jgi:hypothetical protein